MNWILHIGPLILLTNSGRIWCLKYCDLIFISYRSPLNKLQKSIHCVYFHSERQRVKLKCWNVKYLTLLLFYHFKSYFINSRDYIIYIYKEQKTKFSSSLAHVRHFIQLTKYKCISWLFITQLMKYKVIF